jgi:hypothetical protein
MSVSAPPDLRQVVCSECGDGLGEFVSEPPYHRVGRCCEQLPAPWTFDEDAGMYIRSHGILSDEEREAIEEDPHYEPEEVETGLYPTCSNCGSSQFEAVYYVTEVHEYRTHIDASYNVSGDMTVYISSGGDHYDYIDTPRQEYQSTHCAACGEPYEGAIQEV